LQAAAAEAAAAEREKRKQQLQKKKGKTKSDKEKAAAGKAAQVRAASCLGSVCSRSEAVDQRMAGGLGAMGIWRCVAGVFRWGVGSVWEVDMLASTAGVMGFGVDVLCCAVLCCAVVAPGSC
jgi:uncharacterized cupin superfamily protein